MRRSWFTRPPQANGPDTIISHVQVLAEQGNDVQTRLAMLAEKEKEIFAFHQNDLCVIEELGRDFVSAAGQRSAQSQDFSRQGNSQDQPLAGFGADRELRAALAQYKNATCRLPFAKQNGISRTRQSFLHRIQSPKHTCGQIAEEPVWAQNAIEATLLYRALHVTLISCGGGIHSDCSHYFG